MTRAIDGASFAGSVAQTRTTGAASLVLRRSPADARWGRSMAEAVTQQFILMPRRGLRDNVMRDPLLQPDQQPRPLAAMAVALGPRRPPRQITHRIRVLHSIHEDGLKLAEMSPEAVLICVPRCLGCASCRWSTTGRHSGRDFRLLPPSKLLVERLVTFGSLSRPPITARRSRVRKSLPSRTSRPKRVLKGRAMPAVWSFWDETAPA